MQSLWHLRPFTDKFMKKAPFYPHFGVSGKDRNCMLCYLFHSFNAFSDKSDSTATYRLSCLRPSFIKILEEANVSLKVCPSASCAFFSDLFFFLLSPEKE